MILNVNQYCVGSVYANRFFCGHGKLTEQMLIASLSEPEYTYCLLYVKLYLAAWLEL